MQIFRFDLSGRATCRTLISAAVIFTLWGCGTVGSESPPEHTSKHTARTDLPDVLRTASGKRIRTAAQWRKHRDEIRQTIVALEYGNAPGSPAHPPTAKSVETVQAQSGTPAYENITLHFGRDEALTTALHLYLPEVGRPPYPVIVRVGLGGEHARAATERGYAFACYDHESLDPDTEGTDVVGPAQALYPEVDWGSIAVWAWGASRVLDYLETRDDMDTRKSVITGHSRTGKVALLTGVLDERFAMVVPNGSGAGGVAVFRGAGKGVETLELITRESRFKSWFQKDFGQYGDAVDTLPFDQHYMRALIAPRVVLSTDAYGDTWANPRGVQRAWRAAQPVFDLLGVPTHNLIHFREGGHDQLGPDFAVLLDAADAYFAEKAMPLALRADPFPER